MSQSSALVACYIEPVEFKLVPSGSVSGGNRFAGVPAYSDFPAWPACADVLIDSDTRTMAGLTYAVPEEGIEAANAIVRDVDPRWLRLLPANSEAMRSRYPEEFSRNARIEMLWFESKNLAVEIQQLAEPLWYYSSENRRSVADRFLGFIIGDIEELAGSRGYSLPASLLQTQP